MTPRDLFIAFDFAAACTAAFMAGWLFARAYWYRAGYQAGMAWGGRAVRFSEEEPTAVGSRR